MKILLFLIILIHIPYLFLNSVQRQCIHLTVLAKVLDGGCRKWMTRDYLIVESHTAQFVEKGIEIDVGSELLDETDAERTACGAHLDQQGKWRVALSSVPTAEDYPRKHSAPPLEHQGQCRVLHIGRDNVSVWHTQPL